MIDRIRSRHEFERLRRQGRRLRVEPFWCTHLLDSSLHAPRVAFAISRTVGNAVTRNRLRRRLRAILSQLEVPNGWYLIGCQPAAAELTFDQLQHTLERIMIDIWPAESMSTPSRA